ncbi:linker for activation of T-cells family member 2 isoform X1 [Oncorhynchus kisutch]|uniref:linker for activation of T-cells family member 2 isoform X1 n=2 Tax=Oncorhynchus kisutch TaxID=8019 RepID=UPI0012DD6F94|nr:linker for activation of T-cells family member 2 isoform X1 [Oncorhynchus kisutch]
MTTLGEQEICTVTAEYGTSLANTCQREKLFLVKVKNSSMIAIFSLQGAVLAIVSAASLSVFSAFCLWCRRKTKIIHEENQMYDPQIFQREGSRFAVMRSKTVTRPNQIIRELPPTPAEQTPQVVNEEQAKYQNVATAQMGKVEPTYVDPIPVLVYQNVNESANAESETDGDQYENVFPSIDTISRGSDGSDYENSEFLEQVKMGLEPLEDDEPDYVNDTD